MENVENTTPVVEETVVATETKENKEHAKKPFSKDFKGKKPNGKKDFRKGGREEKPYNTTVVFVNRVSKTVKGGRRMRFAALVACGDGKGLVGFGTGKANEVPDSMKKAEEAARKSMKRIPVIKGDTIPHEIIGKYGACEVFLKPAPVGTGVIAGGPVRAILELAGIKNIYSKVYGSRTPINIVRATMNGLTNLKTINRVAKLRGKEPKDIK